MIKRFRCLFRYMIGPLLLLVFLVASFPVTAFAESVPRWDGEIPVKPTDLLGFKAEVKRLAAREVEKIHGIYLPPNSPYLRDVDTLIERLESTRVNAVVIDVKGDNGRLLYDSRLPLAHEIGAVRPLLSDMERVVERLQEAGIFVIARLVVFKDNILASERPEWAIQLPNERVWRDRKGTGWVNPYHPKAWEYILDVALEVAEMGFREIQFDYVRFPTDGNVSLARYPVGSGDFSSESAAIAGFLRRAKNRLGPAGVYVSADVFGLVPSVKGDMGIGQQWEEIVQEVDFVCPMAYPSHYGPGVYGLVDPDSSPYETVFSTVRDGVNRMELLPPPVAKIRPWVQDFSMRARYGPQEVKDQIRAVEEHGSSQWLLWNPSGVYTWEALSLPESPMADERKNTSLK